jgi:hypothetical protein
MHFSLACCSAKLPMPNDPHLHGQDGPQVSLLRMQNGSTKGWSACPTKSVPARMIEDSVVDQLRTALGALETRERLSVSEADWQAFDQGDRGLVRELITKVSYDGTIGAVSLSLRESEPSHEN